MLKRLISIYPAEKKMQSLTADNVRVLYLRDSKTSSCWQVQFVKARHKLLHTLHFRVKTQQTSLGR